jgi:hypothetical protein
MVSDRLEYQVGEMLRLEVRIGSLMEELRVGVSEAGGVGRLVGRVAELSRHHVEGLRERQDRMGWAESPVEKSDPLDMESEYPMSAALMAMSGIVNEAVTGYAMLRSVANRHRDSSQAGEDNTADVAEAHAKGYIGVLVAMSRLLNDVVLDELDAVGVSCACTCPSCDLGVCLCAQAPRVNLADWWAEAGPISVDEGVFVHPPKLGSAAALAGLKHGDTVITADGHHIDGRDLDSLVTLQEVVRSHDHGEEILIEVRRTSGDTETISITRN